jgi:hypothetical protein
MSQSNFQFYTTKSEAVEYLIRLIEKYKLYCIICYEKVPKFTYTTCDFTNSNGKLSPEYFTKAVEVFLMCEPFKENKVKYYDFREDNNYSFLEFEFGEETADCILESSMGFCNILDEELLKIYRKIIRNYRNTMLKGDYFYSLNNREIFPSKHYYTLGIEKLLMQSVNVLDFTKSYRLAFPNENPINTERCV